MIVFKAKLILFHRLYYLLRTLLLRVSTHYRLVGLRRTVTPRQTTLRVLPRNDALMRMTWRDFWFVTLAWRLLYSNGFHFTLQFSTYIFCTLNAPTASYWLMPESKASSNWEHRKEKGVNCERIIQIRTPKSKNWTVGSKERKMDSVLRNIVTEWNLNANKLIRDNKLNSGKYLQLASSSWDLGGEMRK